MLLCWAVLHRMLLLDLNGRCWRNFCAAAISCLACPVNLPKTLVVVKAYIWRLGWHVNECLGQQKVEGRGDTPGVNLQKINIFSKK